MKISSPTRRTFTISFPAELANQVERVAAEEHRTISELFREVFRQYRSQRALTLLVESHAEARAGASQYGPEDVVRLVREVRAEMAAERLGKAS